MANATATKPAASAMTQIVAQNDVAKNVAAAEKAATAAKPRTRRAPQAAAAKTTAPAATVAAKAAKVLGVKYTITAARPVAGRPLRAFTQAVIELLDLTKGKQYDRATLASIIGPRAVNYHLTQTGAFEMTEKGIGLAGSYGVDYFAERANNKEFDPQDVADYKAILTTGKADGRLVKNANFIKPLA